MTDPTTPTPGPAKAEAEEMLFTDDQVASANAYQDSGVWHPFTCGNGCGPALKLTPNGWVCPGGCGYTQDWAHGFMLDWSWKKSPLASLRPPASQMSDDTPAPAETTERKTCCGWHDGYVPQSSLDAASAEIERLRSDYARLEASYNDKLRILIHVKAYFDRNGLAWMPGCIVAELERLRGIVDKLPKTADGVPIVPGMKVWCDGVGCELNVESVYLNECWCSGDKRMVPQGGDMFNPEDLVAARAAAASGEPNG